jgi:O-antigen/teichoic acid export membrane protein
MASYGKGFEEGYWVVVILSFSAVVMAVSNIFGQAIVSKGRMWLAVGLHGTWAIIMLLAAWYLVQGYGATGLALATLIAWVSYTGALTFFNRDAFK